MERLICGDPELRKMDADVNHGFVLMQTRYPMTGAARFKKTNDAHALPFPVNPIDSSVLTPSDGVVTLRYGGHEYLVNRGFVAMQLVESKEISYQDPVRKDQINWIRNVRNKCVNSPCLTEAYRARVQYIKGRISSAYPSYPEKESGQDGG
ncbi:hypothetical protein [Burkholderia ubonensis]|uniref:hypothetical protein n=1 Tax=Burkholderia ubonensis TaxID=101571 RepID=UPI00016A5079|nr:hypothetical protein [Burkholderia ubonensis]